MATVSLEFIPTQGELSVVAAILDYEKSHFGTLSGLSDTPSIASVNAAEILQRSGLSYEQLAHIWTLADEDEDGNLSEKELAIAVRLIGWAQSGKPINRSFVNYSNGPLPTLKDVWECTRNGVESVQFPPVNIQDKIEFNRTFREAGPINGLLDGDKVRDIYLKTNLSYSDLDRIWNVIDTEQRGSLNNMEFAVGMYLIQSVKTCQLPTIPSSIPSHIFDQFSVKSRSPFTTPPVASKFTSTPQSSSTSVKYTISPTRENSEWDVSVIEKAEAQGHFDNLDIDKKGVLDGDESARFMLKFFNLLPNDIAQIWDLVDLRRDNKLNKDQLAVAIHLIHKKLEGQALPTLELPASLIPPLMRSKSQIHVRRLSAPPVPPKRPPPPIPPASRKPSLSMSLSSATSPTIRHGASFSPTNPSPCPPKTPKPKLKNRLSITTIPEDLFPTSQTPSTISSSQVFPSVTPTSKVSSLNPVPRLLVHDQNPLSLTFPSPIIPSTFSAMFHSDHHFGEETLSELSEESRQLRGQLEELMGQLKEQNQYRERNNLLREDNKRLKRRLQEMDQAVNQVMAANEGADRTAELSQEVTRLTQLLITHEHTEKELNETLNSVAELSQENGQLKQRCGDLKAEKISLERELVDVESRMQNLRSEKNSISTRLAEMEKLLVDPQTKGSSRWELQMLLKDVTRENEELKMRERDIQAQMSTILLTNQNYFQLDDLKHANSRLKLQVSELEEVVRGMQASSSDNVLRRRINELEREKEVLHVQVGEMTQRVSGAEELSKRRIGELQSRVRELELMNQSLRHQGPSADESVPPPAYEELHIGD